MEVQVLSMRKGASQADTLRLKGIPEGEITVILLSWLVSWGGILQAGGFTKEDRSGLWLVMA